MLDVNLSFSDISIKNISNEDLLNIYEVIKKDELNSVGGYSDNINLDELQERLLECYISENEFFLKIENNNDDIIGLLKGRVEFKDIAQMWIGYFVLDYDIEDKNFKVNIMNEILKYFKDEYGTEGFYSTIEKNNVESLNFFKENGYKVLRICKNFYNVNGKYKDMMILKRM